MNGQKGKNMRNTHVIRIGLSALVLMVFSLTALAQVDERREIQVTPNSLNCYGHWEGPVVVLERVGNEVFANGWRVHPLLPSQETLKKKRKVETRPWPLFQKRVYRERNKLRKEGLNNFEIVERCLELLRASPLVVEARRETNSSCYVCYRDSVNAVKTKTTTMEFAGGRDWITPEARAELELKNAQAFFRRFASTLESGGMVIIASHVMGENIQITAAHRDSPDVVAALKAVEDSSGEIKSEGWKFKNVFSAGTAEQIRNPMPITRKERR